MNKQFIINLLNILYLLFSILFILDLFASFDIEHQTLKSCSYCGFMIGTIVCPVLNLFVNKSKTQKIIWVSLSILYLIFILFVGPLKILFSMSAWKTQTILYKNINNVSETLEIQLQDMGALGYNERTAKVNHMNGLFMFLSEMPKDIEHNKSWLKVDIEVNNSDIKFP